MQPQTVLSVTAILSLLTLAACGGGGSTDMSEAPPPVMEPEPTPAPQLKLSEAPAVYAKSEADAIARKLPDPTTEFAPFSAAMKQDLTANTVEQATEFRIVTISSDGDNGFHVTYRIGDVDRSVHFTKDDTTGFGTYSKEIDDRRFRLWDKLEAFGTHNLGESRVAEHKDRGSPFLQYVDAGGGWVWGDERYRFVMAYGARTESGDLPAGQADYVGRWRVDSLPADDTDYEQSGIEYRGRLRLTADFDAGTVGGTVDRVRKHPGDRFDSLPSDTGFRISDGEIVSGQFTATMTGYHDNIDPANPPESEDTLNGYEGGMYGAFFGPEAEEVGGVVVAENSLHNRKIQGVFGAKQVTALASPDASPHSVAFKRDRDARTTMLDEGSAVAAISSDGAGGLMATYVIDGTEYRVSFAASTFDTSRVFPEALHGRTGDRGVAYLLNQHTRSFHDVPGFTHFDVHEWREIELGPDGRTPQGPWTQGLVVYGDRTDPSDLPSGTASYSGRMYAETWRQVSRSQIQGSLNLAADFAAGAVSGTVGDLTQRVGPITAPWNSIAGDFTISQGTVSGNALAGTLSGLGYEGTVDGSFFGPGAAEVGAVLEAQNTGNGALLVGFIGGRKQ